MRLWSIARRKLDQLDSVVLLAELRIPTGNNLEALHGNRKGHYRMRINEKYRICFCWLQNEPDSVEVVDYHPLAVLNGIAFLGVVAVNVLANSLSL
jgi:proteic killer suppression protein